MSKLFIILFFLTSIAFAQEEEVYQEEYYSQEDTIFSQEDESYDEYYDEFSPLKDNTLEGQIFFVEEILAASGYLVNKVSVYQTLPNNARVFKVVANDSLDTGFVFVRWNKEKQENFVANKMIDPKLYYNLKAAEEIMRKQTNKKYFTPKDIAIQATDQAPVLKEDIQQQDTDATLNQKKATRNFINDLNKKKAQEPTVKDTIN